MKYIDHDFSQQNERIILLLSELNQTLDLYYEEAIDNEFESYKQ